jgi:DNA-binding MarR family transcriptional regulator
MVKTFKLEEFLPFRLNVLAQDMSQRLSGIYAAKFGLDVPQWRILANLAARGEMTAQEIVLVTLSHKSTISRAVSELENRKLIERTESKVDRRAFSLRLTKSGKDMFAKLLPLVLAFEADIKHQLSKRELEGLQTGLAALERQLATPREKKF